ncbi:hypothetical protein ACP275_04G142800 [Erythranthe tilingii]
MSLASMLHIRDLHVTQNCETLTLKALRVGSEISCGTSFITQLKKLIMTDEHGDRIGVVIFKDNLPHFDGCFSLHKSYIISNAVVKNRNISYFSAHPHFGMVFRKNTIVKEAPTPIADDSLNFNFMDFKDININVHAKDSIDVCGILTKVK